MASVVSTPTDSPRPGISMGTAVAAITVSASNAQGSTEEEY
jgi:hypothetical protein